MLNIMNPPADWSTLKKLIWLRGTPITGGEELTVSGTPPLSLSNSLGKPLKAWSVDLLPYQEGTGDPAPDNVRPIHGTDKVTVWTGGKNLFNPSDKRISKAIFGNDPVGGTASLFDSTATDTYVNVAYLLAGQTYTLSHSRTASPVATANRVGYICDDNGVVLQSAVVTWINGQLYVQITPTVSGWLWASMDKNVTDIQLELGSTVSDYVPYIAPSSSVITLPSTIYSGQVYTGGAEKTWGSIVIDGVNVQGNIVSTYYITETVTRAYCAISDASLPSTTYPQRIQKCNCAVYSSSVIADTQTFYAVNSGTRIEINVRLLNSLTGITTSDSVADAKTKWNAYAAQHPIHVIFQMATPETITLSTPSIPTPRDTATAWATAEDGTVDSMEVTYVGKA